MNIELMEFIKGHEPKKLAAGTDIKKLSDFGPAVASHFAGSRDLLSEWARRFPDRPLEYKSGKSGQLLNIILGDGDANIPVVKMRQQVKINDQKHIDELIQEIQSIRRTVCKGKFGGASYRTVSTIEYNFSSLPHILEISVQTNIVPWAGDLSANFTLCAFETGKIDKEPAMRPVLDYIYGEPAAQILDPMNNIVRNLVQNHPDVVDQMHLSASLDKWTEKPEYEFHIGRCPSEGKKCTLQGTRRIFKSMDAPDGAVLFGEKGKTKTWLANFTEEYHFDFPELYQKIVSAKSWGDGVRAATVDYLDNYLFKDLRERQK